MAGKPAVELEEASFGGDKPAAQTAVSSCGNRLYKMNSLSHGLTKGHAVPMVDCVLLLSYIEFWLLAVQASFWQ